jgi:hypothetical protein
MKSGAGMMNAIHVLIKPCFDRYFEAPGPISSQIYYG